MKMQMIKTVKNDEGFVLVATIFILVIITLAGVFAITNSNTELSIVRNTQLLTREFYEAEAGLIEAIENKDEWMTDDFLFPGDVVPPSTQPMEVDSEGNPTQAIIDARPIRNTAPDPSEIVDGYSDYAYDLPLMAHKGAPPTGFSIEKTYIRRFGITATSRSGKTTLQGGVWKVFSDPKE